jgi:pyruvate dehydrogenase E1 component
MERSAIRDQHFSIRGPRIALRSIRATKVPSFALAPLPRDCGIVTVIDGHPATLGWLGSVRGHRVEALGVEHFGQTGTIDDLYRHHGIDANAIIDAAEGLTVGAPVRHRKMAV